MTDLKELERRLWASADELRANSTLTAAQYRDPVLGLIFLAFQVYEFMTFAHHGLTLQQNLFGSTFFVLTGFHGAHVTIGVLWLLSLWVLDLRGRLAVADAVKVEIAGLYWHFVDVVWIAIFTLIYLIP